MLTQLGGLVAAVRFLTSVPLPGGRQSSSEGLGAALTYFPLVGLLIGAFLLGLHRLVEPWLGRPAADFVVLVGLITISGGLHFDGLVDAADGLPLTGSVAERLAIMRAPWAGPRGACAGLGLLLLQYAALSSLDERTRAPALLLGPMVGRWGIVAAYVAFPYTGRTSGLSLALKRGATRQTGWIATLFTVAAVGVLSWPTGLLLIPLAALVVIICGQVALHRLGGMAGDLYGAIEEILETLCLLLVPPLAMTMGAAR